MSDKTGIEWTDATWNPVTGCSKVSQGCKHCYAEREWPRMTRLVPSYAGRDFTDVRTHADRLDQPLRWKKPRMIFVNSMSDLFHPDVPFEFIDKVFAVMALAPQHLFQVLTKRPDRMRDYLTDEGLTNRVIHEAFRMDCEGGAWMNADHNIGGHQIMPLGNVWLGVSVEDQAAADERIPLLLDTPAEVRWISAEPLLGPVDLTEIKVPSEHDKLNHSGFYPSRFNSLTTEYDDKHYHQPPAKIDWVVVGGESGQNARPMHPAWARSLRDQCAVAGVPFLFKQWGEWMPTERDGEKIVLRFPIDGPHGPKQPEFYKWEDGAGAARVGKKAAGRLLDGVQHDGYPEGGAA